MKIIKKVIGDTYKIKEQLKVEGFRYTSLKGWHTDNINLLTTHKTAFDYEEVEKENFEEILTKEFTPERIADLKNINMSALMFISRDLQYRISAKKDIEKLLEELNASAIEILTKILKL